MPTSLLQFCTTPPRTQTPPIRIACQEHSNQSLADLDLKQLKKLTSLEYFHVIDQPKLSSDFLGYLSAGLISIRIDNCKGLDSKKMAAVR